MSRQITIRVPDALGEALDAHATRSMRNRSEVIRLALTDFLGLESHQPRTAAERTRHLLGSLESGVSDLAENHRRYLLDSLRNGR